MWLAEVRWLTGLHTSEESQIEAAGDLNGFQGQRGGVKGEGHGVDEFGVHQQLRRLLSIP